MDKYRTYLVAFAFALFSVCLPFFTAKAQNKVVKIGLAANLSQITDSTDNPYKDYFRRGIKLALNDSKDELRKSGITIQLDEFDIGKNPINVVSVIEKIAASDVKAVLGYVRSTEALLAAPLHQKYQIPMITPTASANRLLQFGPYVHQACINNGYLAKVMSYVAKEKIKAKRAVIISVADCAYCQDLANAFEKNFQSVGGKTIKKFEVLSGSKDYRQDLKELKNLDFDVVVVPNYELISAHIMWSVLKLQVNKPFLGGDGWGNNSLKILSILEGIPYSAMAVSHWHPEVNNRVSQSFVTKYKSAYNSNPGNLAALAYDSTKILIEAITNAKNLDSSSIEEQLSKMTDYVGVTGKYRKNKNISIQKTVTIMKNDGKVNKLLEEIDPDQLDIKL